MLTYLIIINYVIHISIDNFVVTGLVKMNIVLSIYYKDINNITIW